MLKAGRAAFDRHAWDNGGTYEITCLAETLLRDVFKAMSKAAAEDGKIPREQSRGSAVSSMLPH
jgi:hypothetical protein